MRFFLFILSIIFLSCSGYELEVQVQLDSTLTSTYNASQVYVFALFDQNGNRIYSTTFDGHKKESIDIDTSNLPTDVYMLPEIQVFASNATPVEQQQPVLIGALTSANPTSALYSTASVNYFNIFNGEIVTIYMTMRAY
jgi:hypothetical protein